MENLVIIAFGKIISKLFRFLNLGDGSTWPGHIALGLNKNFIKQILNKYKTKIIIVAGTNGKTTTSALIKTALEKNSKKVFQNNSGANLLNGIASSIILNAETSGKLNHDFAIFEIDENNLPLILQEIEPDYLVLLNLFRDQLDRYGEVNIVAGKWKTALDVIARRDPSASSGQAAQSLKRSPRSARDDKRKTTFILNADDPQIAHLGLEISSSSEHSESRSSSSRQARTIKYFCFNDLNHESKKYQHAADSTHCPNCGEKLIYKQVIFSHLGDWFCESCGLKRPKADLDNFPIYPLPGIYNKYNTHAAVLVLKQIGLSAKEIANSFENFQPAFGRQEIIDYKGKKVQIFLSKNPTSFNQSFKTIYDLGAKNLLLVLNDRIPDGRDVSWIWDTDLTGISNFKNVIVSGDRAYDMSLRLKYENCKNIQAFKNLAEAIEASVNTLNENETLFVLPTYSAMLETRKIITGKKIL